MQIQFVNKSIRKRLFCFSFFFSSRATCNTYTRPTSIHVCERGHYWALISLPSPRQIQRWCLLPLCVCLFYCTTKSVSFFSLSRHFPKCLISLSAVGMPLVVRLAERIGQGVVAILLYHLLFPSLSLSVCTKHNVNMFCLFFPSLSCWCI